MVMNTAIVDLCMIIIAVEIWGFLGSENTYYVLLCYNTVCSVMEEHTATIFWFPARLLSVINNPYSHDIYVLKLTSLKYTCFYGALASIVWYFLNVIINMLMNRTFHKSVLTLMCTMTGNSYLWTAHGEQ